MDFKENPNIKDRFKTTLILLYVLGTVASIASHFFSTATDYWFYKFRDPNEPYYNSSSRTELQMQFTSSFTIVSSVGNVLFLIITFLLIKKIGIFVRTITSLVAITGSLAFTAIMTQVDTDSWQKEFFGVTILTEVFLSGGCGIFLISIIEIIAKFPPTFLPALLTGQALSGVLSAIVQILALSAGTSSINTGLIYFLTAFIFVILALAMFVYHYFKSKFFMYYLNQGKKTTDNTSSIPKINIKEILSLLNATKWLLLTMAISLGATIIANPAITALVVSKNKGNGNAWNESYFVPVCTFLLYNVMDVIGRETARLFPKPKNHLYLVLAAFLRIGFIPMVMYCNIGGAKHLQPVFTEDYMYVLIMLFLALTNGYVLNTAVLVMPTVLTEGQMGIASGLLSGIMMISLAFCSLISSALIKLI